MTNTTNTTSIITTTSSNTVLEKAIGTIYSNRLRLVSTDFKVVVNEDFYGPLYNQSGILLNCPIYDEPYVDSTRHLEMRIGSQYAIPFAPGANYHNIYANGQLDGSSEAQCTRDLTPAQERDFDEFFISERPISEFRPSKLHGLYGRITTATNNNTFTNTNHTVPVNCDKGCPEGQCFGSVEELFPFTTNSTTFSTSTEENGCRRVAALYLRGAYTGSSTGFSFTDEQIRNLEEPCGLLVTCNVASIGDYVSTLRIRLKNSTIVSATDHIANVSIGSGNYMTCYPSLSGFLLIPERAVFVDGACSDFEDKWCLSENSIDIVEDFILRKKVNINNDITVNEYVEQNCPEPVCGSEFCPTTEATEPTTVSTTTVLVTEPSVTSVVTDSEVTTTPTINTDVVTTDMDNNSNNNSVNVGAIVGGIIASIFVVSFTVAVAIFLFKFDKSMLLKIKAKINKVLGRTSTIVSEHELESKAKAEDSAV